VALLVIEGSGKTLGTGGDVSLIPTAQAAFFPTAGMLRWAVTQVNSDAAAASLAWSCVSQCVTDPTDDMS
jgi:hypothetical protein